MKRLDLVSNRKWLFLFSGGTALLAIVLLLIPPALRPGIEFTSGTTMHLRFSGGAVVPQDALREEFDRLGHDESRIQSTGPFEFLIRTRNLNVPPGSFTEARATATATATVEAGSGTGTASITLGKAGQTGNVSLRAVVGGDPCKLGIEAGNVAAGTKARVIDERKECADGTVYRVQAGNVTGFIAASDTREFVAAAPSATPSASATPAATRAATATPRPTQLGERGEIEAALEKRFGNFEVLEFTTVAPVVSAAAVRNASVAVIVAALFIMGYIAFAFSSVPRPVRYATCAIIATLHDVIIVLGAFSLFGKVFGLEVNLMFITGLLTVIGFSVHDTIVVFDRIRENVRLAPSAPLAENVNAALVQTLSRSFNTSITVLLTILAMLLLGGASIREFLLVLLVGIVSGVYSSVGVAAQLLVSWEEGDFGRLRARLSGRRSSEAPAP